MATEWYTCYGLRVPILRATAYSVDQAQISARSSRNVFELGGFSVPVSAALPRYQQHIVSSSYTSLMATDSHIRGTWSRTQRKVVPKIYPSTFQMPNSGANSSPEAHGPIERIDAIVLGNC